MGQLIRLAERLNPQRLVFFDRAELNQLLSLYARHVADGEWRDYALDLSDGVAAFSVFRRADDGPAFIITKRAPSAGGRGRFALARGARRLREGPNLRDVLAPLERRLTLVPPTA